MEDGIYFRMLENKSKVIIRRRNKFRARAEIRKTHWANHAGTFNRVREDDTLVELITRPEDNGNTEGAENGIATYHEQLPLQGPGALEVRNHPKFYRSQRPFGNHHRRTEIRTHHGLVAALYTIHSGDMHQDQYHTVSGLDRERLRTAQSLRDRGKEFDPSMIARLGYRELATYSRNR